MEVPNKIISNDATYIRLDAILDWLDRQETKCYGMIEMTKSEAVKQIYTGKVCQIDCMRIMLDTL